MTNDFKYLHQISINNNTCQVVFAAESIASFCGYCDDNQSHNLFWPLFKLSLANEDSLLSNYEQFNLLSFYANLSESTLLIGTINYDLKIN